MDPKLLELFLIQASCIYFNGNNKNEFQTMRLLFDQMPAMKRQFLRRLSLNYLHFLEQTEKVKIGLKEAKVMESKDLRLQGNRLFTAKGNERNVLGACRLYSDAIYMALDTKSVELALGFANRAAALLAFGYYRQAYDDCVYALKLGYPELSRHKIITRQAFCSIKMQDLRSAEKHLNELQKLTLDASFTKDLMELLKDFDDLKHEMSNKEDNSNEEEDILLTRGTQEIITTNNGRYMQAKCEIKKNQLIFTERASAFVVSDDSIAMCHQCGTINLIPIPCLNCHGKVNYCSLKCQEKHLDLHLIECPAYRIQLFGGCDITRLALRTILDNGIYSVLDELNLGPKSSTYEVWRKLDKGGDVWKNKSIPYAESLRTLTHLNKMSNEELQTAALASHQLVVYLEHYTKYFEVLNARNGNINWELLTASLLLRHICQFTYRVHTFTTLVPKRLTAMSNTAGHMLNEFVWSSAWHLKLGCLHYFADNDDVASLNLPYLNNCNHSCVKFIGTKYSGRLVSTYALRNIKKGEEIKNYLDETYFQEKFDLKGNCKDCLKNEDDEFNKFRQYRCDNTKCGKIYIPSPDTLSPMHVVFCDFSIAPNVICTICGHKQDMKYLYEAELWMSRDSEAIARRRLFQIFKESEQYLTGLNECRCVLAQQLVSNWFYLYLKNVTLNDQDNSDMVEMVKYILNVEKERFSVISLEYVVGVIFLWDLMAKRKYKCSQVDMDEMLLSLNILPDDLKLIFTNYYNDYIKDYYML